MKTKPKGSPWISTIDSKLKSCSMKKKKNKMYYNANQLKKHGYLVDIQNRILESNHSSLTEFPTPARYYARMLIRLGFQHQINLFN
jgi:hypothetical protein